MKAVPMIGIIWSIALLVFSQTPAPEPAVDNQMRVEERNNFPLYDSKEDSVNEQGATKKWIELNAPGELYGINEAVHIVGILESAQDTVLTQSRLIKLWQQYKAECYADSSIRKVHRDSTFTPCQFVRIKGDSLACTYILHHKMTWIHKQPTAEGFFDWLGGRVK